ncbi:hypothetical protein LIER_11675 [Lithospermum erythrorhizon]|uniref:Gag-pol polyprotein n=1 Tax=Lithospermum erythrorhizon TaxID=34254 RepID=A0AAV3PNX8_LITER
MTTFLKSIDSKTWKSVISGWIPPTKADEEGGGRVVKTEAERTPADDKFALGNDKALNAIFTAVDPNVFKMISNCTVSKEAWKILQTAYEVTAKAAPVRYKVRDVNSSIEENVVKSTRKDQGSDDDDVVVVSSTASKRRTRASVIALEKKRAVLGVGGNVEAEEVMDLEELEKLMQKKKATKKGKENAKRPSVDELKEGAASKKRKEVFVSESSQGRNKDKFIINDLEESSGEDAACLARKI